MMKADRESRALLILNLDARWKWGVSIIPGPLYPWGSTPVPTEKEAFYMKYCDVILLYKILYKKILDCIKNTINK